MKTLRKILVINIFGIGDVLFTTPLLSNLKKDNPSIAIGYICNRRTAPILKNNPYVDKIFIYERDEFYAFSRQSKFLYWKKLLEFWRGIRKEQYDAVIDLSLSPFMGFFTWGIGIKNRMGFNYRNRSLFLTDKVDLRGYEDKHVVEYYLDLLRHMGIACSQKRLEIYLEKEDQVWSNEFLVKNGLDGKKLKIGLLPGGGESWGKEAFAKRWPPEGYAKLADKLFEKFAAEIILMGGLQDVEVCREVVSFMRHKPHFACGMTSLGQFAALAQSCHIVIASDGGPLHVVCAAGVKTVSIFGPVDERVYGPFPSEGHGIVKKDLPCRPCYRQFRRAQCEHRQCLNTITPEDILRTVENILRGN